jgi:hypothetical protein
LQLQQRYSPTEGTPGPHSACPEGRDDASVFALCNLDHGAPNEVFLQGGSVVFEATEWTNESVQALRLRPPGMTAASEPSRPTSHSLRKPCYAWRTVGGNMSADTIEKVITNAIHTAFIKYPEGDGGPNLDYDWITPEQSSHITKAILLDLNANGFQIVKKA